MDSKWKSCQLGDIITFQRGHDLPKTKMIDGQYPVVGSNGIIGYHNEYTTEAPSITVGRSGNTGKPFIVYGRTWSHNTSLHIKEYKGADPVYVYYLLQTLDLNSYAGGSAVPTLNRNHIHIINVIVPPMAEQIEIGRTLKTLDDKIENNTKINHHLEQMAQAVFKSWFVDFEPFGGNMPADWRSGTLADLGDIIGGSTPSKARPEYYTDNGIAWITPKDLSVNKSKFIAHGADDITELGFRNSSVRLMPQGTVLFSSRAPIGYIAIANGEVCTNQGFKSVVPKGNVGTAFIYYFLLENLQTIENMASGSTFKEISGSAMKVVPATIPDDDTLRRFQEECAYIFKEQELLEAENVCLAELRDMLLPRLMSGELSVANIQAAK